MKNNRNSHSEKKEWSPRSTRQSLKRYLGYFLFAVVLIGMMYSLGFKFFRLVNMYNPIFDLFGRMVPPDIEYIPSNLIKPTLETFYMSILGTVLGVLLSIPTAWFAARNVTPIPWLTYPIGRFLITFTRSLHSLIWGMIFVAAVGFGPLPGVLALGVRGIGFVGKLLAEEIEDIDEGQVEAIKAAGGNSFQVLLFGVVPQVIPEFVGISVYRWDICVRASAILGFVGAGGLGFELQQTMNLFQYQRSLAIILIVIVLVTISESISAVMRGRVT
ncbi:phosphonate ABC transporter, permease protein PhnE [Candidatus Bipolaricaulota bacterium]|nr:phosphonate ABC transporter, permease protein PhnE [Candidatus Bipolaricaulota bacterium]